MSGSQLRHLAIIADAIVGDAGGTDAGAPPPQGRAAALVAAVDRAATIARSAFRLAPALQVVTFFAPETRTWLAGRSEAAALGPACAQAARSLEDASREMGAHFALRGEAAGLPAELGPFFERPLPADGRRLLWLLNYGGREEIARAASAPLAGSPPAPITEEGLAAHLYTSGLPDPDLLLFAGGELEPKDALLWQGSYAEIWHTPRRWLLFTEADLARAIGDFTARQRRFGR